jgi:hypothetical protein
VARARLLSKSFSTSEKRAALHARTPALAEFAQALFPLLVVHADDLGRFDGDAFTIKHQVDPTSPRSLDDFDAALTALDDVGLITRYIDLGIGKRALQIVDFKQHQPGLKQRETASRFSAPPDRGNPRQPTAFHGNPRQPAEESATHGSRARAELNRTEEEDQQASSIDRGERDQQASSGEVRAQLRRAHDPDPRTADDNVAVIANLVATEFADTQLAGADLTAAIKQRCADLHITYDSTAIRKALDSAAHHRKAARA